MAQFVGVIHKEKRSDYGVSFPDFPGCITVGRTMQEAFEMAREALQFHIDGMVEDTLPLPKRHTSLDEAKKIEPDAEAFFMVEATIPGKVRRVNVMLDEDLLSCIETVSDNRSAFLNRAGWSAVGRDASIGQFVLKGGKPKGGASKKHAS